MVRRRQQQSLLTQTEAAAQPLQLAVAEAQMAQLAVAADPQAQPEALAVAADPQAQSEALAVAADPQAQPEALAVAADPQAQLEALVRPEDQTVLESQALHFVQAAKRVIQRRPTVARAVLESQSQRSTLLQVQSQAAAEATALPAATRAWQQAFAQAARAGLPLCHPASTQTAAQNSPAPSASQ